MEFWQWWVLLRCWPRALRSRVGLGAIPSPSRRSRSTASPPGGQLFDLYRALDAAALAWGRIAGVSYQRVAIGPCDSTTSSVTFNVQRDAHSEFPGASFFPGDDR